MSTTLLQQIEHLPASQKQILLDFAEYLVKKYTARPSPKKKKRQAGTLKGFLVYMADDFNAPLDDFKDYM